MAKKKKSSSRLRRYLIAFAAVVGFFLLIIGYRFYHKVYAPNVSYADDKEYLYVPTGTGYTGLVALLKDKKIIKNVEAFQWVAMQMNLPSHVHAGRYKLEPRMNNYDLVKLLRSGKQAPVKLVINKFRLKEDFAGYIGRKLEVDSATLLISLNDKSYLRSFGVTPETSMELFIPNTYEFFWNTSAAEFMERMKEEKERFWTEDRIRKAYALSLTPAQAITLASIVEEETNNNNEKRRIAGVYLNRIKRSMLLQADPTVKFALKDFAIKRVLNVHLAVSSPYNTYLHKGLPPGPICTPSVKTIDAVLNAEPHDYLYFCASADMPGTHVFAKTYADHLLNARKYQKFLSRRLGQV